MATQVSRDSLFGIRRSSTSSRCCNHSDTGRYEMSLSSVEHVCVPCTSSGSSYSNQTPMITADSEYYLSECCAVSLHRGEDDSPVSAFLGLWSKHLSICSMWVNISAGSVLHPGLSPDDTAALLHCRERRAPFLVPCSARNGCWWSSEAWCTKKWHVMGPAFRDAVVDDYSRCWIGSIDSLCQQTADVCVHRQSWI